TTTRKVHCIPREPCSRMLRGYYTLCQCGRKVDILQIRPGWWGSNAIRLNETARVQIANASPRCIEEMTHEIHEHVPSCTAGCARGRRLCVVGFGARQRGKGCRHRQVHSTGAPPVSQRGTADAAGRRVQGLHGCRGLSTVTAPSPPRALPACDASRDHRATFVLPAAALGRTLSDVGRPSGEVILCSILQVASPAACLRHECSSGGSMLARGRLTDRGGALR